MGVGDRRLTAGPDPTAGPPDPKYTPAYLAVGRLGRPHGVKGEIHLELLTDFPEQFQPGAQFVIGQHEEPEDAAKTEVRTAAIQSVRPFRDHLLVLFDIATDRDMAARLTGQHLYIPTSEAHPLEPDTYYPHELIGLAVVTDGGEAIGTVTGLMEVGETDVLRIRRVESSKAQSELQAEVRGEVQGADRGHELLVPMTGDFIADVDVAGGRVVIHPVAGLLDL